MQINTHMRYVLAAGALFAAAAQANDPAAAIFVDNRAGTDLDSKVAVYRDKLGSELMSRKFIIIDPEQAVRVLKDYEGMAIVQPGENQISGPALDALLLKNTSALNLARNLGADFLIQSSINDFDSRIQKVTAFGRNETRVTHTLRLSYRIVDAGRGGGFLGDTIEVSETERSAGNVSVADSGILNRLLSKGAKQVAEVAKAQVGESGDRNALAGQMDRVAQTGRVPVSITATVRGLTIPMLTSDETGQYSVTDRTFPIEATGVEISIDGSVVGTAPATIEVAPGFHNLKLTRHDLQPFSRMINVSKQGMDLTLELTPSEAALAKWKREMAFFEELKKKDRLNEAQAEKIKGAAQMLRQSGYRLDIKRGENDGGALFLGTPSGVGVQRALEIFDLPTDLDSAGGESGGTSNLESAIRNVEKAVGVVTAYRALKSGKFEPIPIGTVWGYQPNAFATNAHVAVEVAAAIEYKMPVKVLMNKQPRVSYDIVGLKIHPNYGKVLAGPTGDNAIENHSDVAVLFTKATIEHLAPVAGEDELRRIDAGTQVFYVGFPMRALRKDNVDLSSPLATVKIGNLTTVSDFWLGDSGYEKNQLIRHNMGSTGGASGSPIFNSAGHVVALHNAGNVYSEIFVRDESTGEIVTNAEGDPQITTIPSGVGINFGIRADMLKDL